MAMVKVYNWVKGDIQAGANVRSRVAGTLSAIKLAEGKALLETEREVDERKLDGNGFLPLDRG